MIQDRRWRRSRGWCHAIGDGSGLTPIVLNRAPKSVESLPFLLLLTGEKGQPFDKLGGVDFSRDAMTLTETGFVPVKRQTVTDAGSLQSSFTIAALPFIAAKALYRHNPASNPNPRGFAMRRLVVAALLIAAATPAVARSTHADDAEAARIARTINDPRTQDGISGMMTAMADMMLDLRVDKLRNAVAKIDPEARFDDDGARTIGDMVERDDPYFRERLSGETRQATRMMGTMATTMAAMLPEFRAMGEKIERDMDRAMRKFPQR